MYRHVDSEDIANEKIRTNDLALEINKVSIDDDTNNTDTGHDHLMATQSGDPNNKSKPAYKKPCSYCHKNNHVVSNFYQKQRNDEYQRNKNQRSRTPQQSFVQYFRSKPTIHKKIETKIQMIIPIKIIIHITKTIHITMIDIDIILDIDAIVEIIRKTITDLILDKDTRIDLKARINLDPYKTIIIKEELHPDLHIDHHTEITPIRDFIPDQKIDLVLNHKETPSDDTITHIRSPSRPRDYRSRSRTPSQNRQQNRINQVDVKSTEEKDCTKFEIHICQINEIANTITPYSCFYPLYIHASEEKHNIIPSKLEILFLLVTGASISVLNLPTFHIIAKQLNLNVPKNMENKRAKTLIIANQTEVPIIFQ